MDSPACSPGLAEWKQPCYISTFKNPACLPSHDFSRHAAEKYVFGCDTFLLWSGEIMHFSPHSLFLAICSKCSCKCCDGVHFLCLSHSEVTFGINLLVTMEDPRDPLGRRWVIAHKATLLLVTGLEGCLGHDVRVLRDDFRSFILTRVETSCLPEPCLGDDSLSFFFFLFFLLRRLSPPFQYGKRNSCGPVGIEMSRGFGSMQGCSQPGAQMTFLVLRC